MPWQASDSTAAFNAGVNAGNVAQQRQERMMAMRAQASLQAIRERELAAQADMLTQHAREYEAETLQKQQERIRSQALARASVDKHAELMKQQGMTQEEATAQTLAIMAVNFPEDAKNMAAAYENIKQGQMAGKARPLDPSQVAANEARAGASNAAADLSRARIGEVGKVKLPAAAQEAEYLATVKGRLDELNQKVADPGLAEIAPEDEKERKRLQVIVDSIESSHGQEETTIDMPGGPQVRVVKGARRGAEEGALTTAEKTKLGEDLQSSSNALRNLNRLRDQMGTGTVGALPTVENFVFDQVLGQLAPDLVDKKRVAGRQNIRLSTQQVLGELNNRGRISNMELQAIKDAMPSLGMGENDPNAKVKLDELRVMLAEKGAAAAVRIKRPVDPEILQTLGTLFQGAAGERALANEVRNGSLDVSVALQVRKWQKMKGF